MKLLIVTSLKEYQKTVAKIMDQSGIEIFSVSETMGYKDHGTVNLLDNWFSNGTEKFDSIFLFSFAKETNAEKALGLIAKYNEEHDTGFPVRGFIVPVDNAVTKQNFK